MNISDSQGKLPPAPSKALPRAVVFALDERLFALPLHEVVRVTRAVEITSLPDAPELIQGVINVQGEIVPVVDLRRRFGLPSRPLSLEDQLLVARSARRTLAMAVDATRGIVDGDPDEPSGRMRRVVKGDADMILVQDVDELLSAEAERWLDEALGHG